MEKTSPMDCRANVQELFQGNTVSWCLLQGGRRTEYCTNVSLLLPVWAILAAFSPAMCCHIQLFASPGVVCSRIIRLLENSFLHMLRTFRLSVLCSSLDLFLITYLTPQQWASQLFPNSSSPMHDIQLTSLSTSYIWHEVLLKRGATILHRNW